MASVDAAKQNYYNLVENTSGSGKRIVDTRKTETNTYQTDELQALLANNQIDASKITNVQTQQVSTNQSECTDGKDDGKVGFFEGLGSVLKGAFNGVVNGIKGMFTDENGKFSLWNTIKSVATIGACFIPGVGPFISAGLCAYGCIKGGSGLIKGISAAANAKTDGEAKAALESCGANGVTLAASAYGLKGSMSAIAKNAGVAGAAENGIIKNAKAMATDSATGKISLKALGKNAKNSVNMNSNYYSGVWEKGGKLTENVSNVIKKGGKGTVENVGNAYHAVKNKFSKKPTIEKGTVENMKDFDPDTNSFKKAEKPIQNKNQYDQLNDFDPDSFAKENNIGNETLLDKGKNKVSNIKEGVTETVKKADNALSEKSTIYKKGSETAKAAGKKASGYYQKAKSAGSKYYHQVRDTFNNAGSGEYTGIASPKTNFVATASATAAGHDYDQDIQNASTSYSTVDTEGGRYYELENYNLHY